MRVRLPIPILTSLLLLASIQVALAQEGEGDPVRGGELYVENCAVCHGVDGKGRIGASLDSFSGIEPHAAMQTIIAEGVPGSVMPAWALAKAWPSTDPQVYVRQVVSQGIEGSLMPAWADSAGGPLSDEDVADVAAFILTLEPAAAPTPIPPPAAPPGGAAFLRAPEPAAAPTPIPPTAGPLGATTTLILLAVGATVVLVVLVVYYRRPRTE